MRSAGRYINAPGDTMTDTMTGTMGKSRQTSDTKARGRDIQHVLAVIEPLICPSVKRFRVL